MPIGACNRVGALALMLTASLTGGSALAADYWTTFTGNPLTSASLMGSVVTVTGASAFALNSPPFTISDVAFYPDSLKTLQNHLVVVPAPASYRIEFGAPVTDPMIAVYSLDNSGVTLAGTVQTNGDPIAMAGLDASETGVADVSVPSLSGPGAGARTGTEGCLVTYPGRVCGMFRLRGVYSAIELGRTGTADGVGIQIGRSIVPVAVPDSAMVPYGVTQVAIADLRTNDRLEGGAGTLIEGPTTVGMSGSWPAGISLNPATGAVTVDSSVPPGQHVMSYTLCDAADASNCVDSTVTISVGPKAVPATSWPGLAMLAGGLLAMAGRMRRQRKSATP